ncbi:MAG: hypothetical protein KKA60_16230 [Proteobacteria bacterium]|nr:hypothetical protein [Pseudomonadota bacterium]
MIRLGACILSILTICSCVDRGRLPHPVWNEDASAYLEVLESWTQSGSIYDGLDSALLVDATFRSLPFRLEYAREYARIYLLDPEEAARMAGDQVSAWQANLDFTVAAYTPKMGGNDFSGVNSSWRVYLENDEGIRVSPLEIRSFSQDRNVAGHFYPYFTPWKKAYIFRFPHVSQDSGKSLLTPETQWLSLVITGPSGSARLAWGQPEAGWESAAPEERTPMESPH